MGLINVFYTLKETLSYGVPHGLVLGLLLFTLYITPHGAIISIFDMNHHQFRTLEKLQQCLISVLAWLTGSKLKLNPSKT